ncbi:MAG: type VI secretion system lipoprotein TssJ [Desulfobacteraceae bacterium]|nr:type VI secretion system lipoprotein TssJ [Desulfobacteraceae bacterium]
MRYLPIIAICLISALVVSCASQPLPAPEWTYEKDAIKVHIAAHPNLNFDDGDAHTLVACLYQLKDPNTFNQFSDDTDGIYKLLQCGLFDSSVATAKRLIISPGQDIDIALDRAQDSKYIAMAAGYYTLQKQRMIRLYDIPVVEEKKGWLRRTRISKPGKIEVQLKLGPSQIEGN